MNVADITLTPAIPGTITSRSACRPENTAPNSSSSTSGSRKLKNAAVGLRQNMRRSSRYWRHAARAHDGAAPRAPARPARMGSNALVLTRAPALR